MASLAMCPSPLRVFFYRERCSRIRRNVSSALGPSQTCRSLECRSTAAGGNAVALMSNSAQQYKPGGTMSVSKNKLAAVLLGAVALGSIAPPAVAETWPNRTITAIIPFAAGNANDITGRIVFEQLSRQLGQPIVIDNRAGAGGTIGVGAAARATPDGYTMLFH